MRRGPAEEVLLAAAASALLACNANIYDEGLRPDAGAAPPTADASADAARGGDGVRTCVPDMLLSRVLFASTRLHPTDASFEFEVRAWNGGVTPRLLVFKKSDTGSSSTEVHVLSLEVTEERDDRPHLGESWIHQSGTDQPETSESWDIEASDWNGDDRTDMVAVNRRASGDTLAFNVVSGEDDFDDTIHRASTTVSSLGIDDDVELADYDGDGHDDLWIFQSDDAGIDLVVLSGIESGPADDSGRVPHATELASLRLDLPAGGEPWDFEVADWDRDGIPDVVGVRAADTDCNGELHILGGAGGFATRLWASSTELTSANTEALDVSVADVDDDDALEILIVHGSGESGSTEVEILEPSDP